MDAETRAAFVASIIHGWSYISEAKVALQYERLGLTTRYSQKIERTELAEAVLELLLAADDWLHLEADLQRENQQLPFNEREYLPDNVKIKPLLERLLKSGAWLSEDEFEYGELHWITVLTRKGYINNTQDRARLRPHHLLPDRPARLRTFRDQLLAAARPAVARSGQGCARRKTR